MKIQFILVEPLYPENIGSAARAIKTMGFADLILVNPCNHLSKEAQWLAHGSIDMLENATIYKTLEEALSEVDFVVATTSKKRKTNYNYYSPSEINTVIENKKNSVNTVGILFGREDIGLSNEQLKLADILSTVPLKCSYPSINLAQTVMIFSYELAKIELIKPEISISNSDFTYSLLKEKLIKSLEILEIKEDSNLHNRILERISLIHEEDINLMLSYLNKTLDKLED